MSRIIFYIRGIISDWLLYQAMVVAPKGDKQKLAKLVLEYMKGKIEDDK